MVICGTISKSQYIKENMFRNLCWEICGKIISCYFEAEIAKSEPEWLGEAFEKFEVNTWVNAQLETYKSMRGWNLSGYNKQRILTILHQGGQIQKCRHFIYAARKWVIPAID
jgi:hypothetical protein